jgi:CBS domain-containing protein
MTKGSVYLMEDASASDAARRMAEQSIGALPVCDTGGQLRGMITDRDLVVDVLAKGKDPKRTRLSELVHEQAFTVAADDDVDDAVRTMQSHKVRRLLVVDGTQLVGIVSQGDIARSCPPALVGELVAAISED